MDKYLGKTSFLVDVGFSQRDAAYSHTGDDPRSTWKHPGLEMLLAPVPCALHECHLGASPGSQARIPAWNSGQRPLFQQNSEGAAPWGVGPARPGSLPLLVNSRKLIRGRVDRLEGG